MASLSASEVELIRGIRDKCRKFRKDSEEWYVGSSAFRHPMLIVLDGH